MPINFLWVEMEASFSLGCDTENFTIKKNYLATSKNAENFNTFIETNLEMNKKIGFLTTT